MKYLNGYQILNQLFKLIYDVRAMTEVITEKQQVTLSDQRLKLLSQELQDAAQEFLDKIAELEKLLASVNE